MSFLDNLRKAASVQTSIVKEDNFLSDDFCDELVNELSTIKFDEATVDNDHYDETIRKAAVTYIIDEALQDRIIDFIKLRYNVDANRVPMFDVLRYHTGGHYIAHSDGSHVHVIDDHYIAKRVIELDRDLGVILYLNKDFTGGDLVFDHTNERLAPKKGMLVAFPSDWKHLHHVEEITSGVRYAIVTWFSTTPNMVPLEEEIPLLCSKPYQKGHKV